MVLNKDSSSGNTETTPSAELIESTLLMSSLSEPPYESIKEFSFDLY